MARTCVYARPAAESSRLGWRVGKPTILRVVGAPGGGGEGGSAKTHASTVHESKSGPSITESCETRTYWPPENSRA